jgi:hypothetical protein
VQNVEKIKVFERHFVIVAARALLYIPTMIRDEETRNRLIHRSAWLSLGASLFFFVGLLTFGTTVQNTEDAAIRAASGTPFAAALGSAAWAWATRAKLRALPRRDHVPDIAGGPSDEQGAPESDGSSAGQRPASRT